MTYQGKVDVHYIHIHDKEHLEQCKLALEEVWDAAPHVESLPTLNAQWHEEKAPLGRWVEEGMQIRRFHRWLDLAETTRLCVETYDGDWVMYFESVTGKE